MAVKDCARLWKPVKESGFSLYKAIFQKFAFKKHSHDDYAIGVIEEGSQKFWLGGETHVVPASSMFMVNPGEVHDGMSASCSGYRYRVTYVPRDMVSDILGGLFGGRRVSHFKLPVTGDVEIARAMLYSHRLLESGHNNLLEAETSLMQVVAEVFIRHGEDRVTPGPAVKNEMAVKKAIAHIREHAADNITLEELSKVAGLSRYHFLRQFKATTGLTPHAYLLQSRIYLARRALEKGYSLTDAAYRAGFFDQSHFSRNFKAIHGFTPGSYQKEIGS